MQDMKTVERRKRSEELNAQEKRAYKRFVESFPTIQDCADAIGFHRNTVSNILAKGTAHPDFIKKIRETINVAKVQAA